MRLAKEEDGRLQLLQGLARRHSIQLTIGVQSTARLRLPQDGLFTSCVAAVDTSNSTYRF